MAKKNKSFSGLVYSTNPDAMQSEYSEDETTLPPHQQKLKIEIDKKKSAGKVVTVISGFVGKESDLIELCKIIKSKIGCGGSVKEGEIIIQGEKKENIMLILNYLNFKIK